MSKKRVGIPMHLVAAGVFGIGISYYDYFDSIFGDVEIVPLTPNTTIDPTLDLVIMVGGADVDSGRYDTAPSVFTGAPNPFLEHFDNIMVPQYIEAGVPLFGVCRGFQSLNVMFGGTLSEVNHPTNPRDEGGKEMHEVHFCGDARTTRELFPHIFPVLGGKMKVNSRHHQGVRTNQLSDSFIPLYLDNKTASDWSVVEAMVHKTLQIAAVQWHPEDLLELFSIRIVTALLDKKPLTKYEGKALSTEAEIKKLQL